MLVSLPNSGTKNTLSTRLCHKCASNGVCQLHLEGIVPDRLLLNPGISRYGAEFCTTVATGAWVYFNAFSFAHSTVVALVPQTATPKPRDFVWAKRSYWVTNLAFRVLRGMDIRSLVRRLDTLHDERGFSDPSALAASTASTNVFIKSVLSVMNTYGFDGIEIECARSAHQYFTLLTSEVAVGNIPSQSSAGDKANYPTFPKAIKKAFSPFGYGLVGSTVSSNVPRSQVLLQSFTAPSGYWYLQNYDRPNLLANGAADWVNVMTYDLHGIWDSPADYISSIVLVVWKCRFRSDLNRAHPAARRPHEPVHAVSSSSFPLRRE
ncbi:glycoside hydrolase superfamily [Mycena olivaceomarginata]|nr:glycoside hydrolase superfamily [Mycena olivaceomarginata]